MHSYSNNLLKHERSLEMKNFLRLLGFSADAAQSNESNVKKPELSLTDSGRDFDSHFDYLSYGSE